MTTHFGYQIPDSENYASWFFFDAYDAPRKILIPQLVKKIYEAGYRKIYLSMGCKYAENQKNVQKIKDFRESMKHLDGIAFDVVVIDCINPPDVSIAELFPAPCYLMGENRAPYVKELYESWITTQKALNPTTLPTDNKFRLMLDEVRMGKNVSYSNYTITKQNCWRKLAGLPLLLLVLNPATEVMIPPLEFPSTCRKQSS